MTSASLIQTIPSLRITVLIIPRTLCTTIDFHHIRTLLFRKFFLMKMQLVCVHRPVFLPLVLSLLCLSPNVGFTFLLIILIYQTGVPYIRATHNSYLNSNFGTHISFKYLFSFTVYKVYSSYIQIRRVLFRTIHMVHIRI